MLTCPRQSGKATMLKNLAEKLRQNGQKAQLHDLARCDMAEAVETAHSHAKSGDIVSLSPACASFDMYRMFEDRGNHFKSLVNAL